MKEFILRKVLGISEEAEGWEKFRSIITIIVAFLLLYLAITVQGFRNEINEAKKNCCACPDEINLTELFSSGSTVDDSLLNLSARPLRGDPTPLPGTH
jgi:hypothetical protein